MKVTTVLGTAAVTVVLALGAVTAASAAPSSAEAAATAATAPTASVAAEVVADTVADDERRGPRDTRSCTRVGGRIARVEKLQARLHADAGTQGSLAFLQSRVDRATADGRSDQARLLTDRLAIRKDLDARLPDLLARLKDIKAVCD